MTASDVFPRTDILWPTADDITIETAGGYGDRHAQVDYWTDGDFLPGRPQPADPGMARRNEALYCCSRHRAGFHTLCGLPTRRMILHRGSPTLPVHTPCGGLRVAVSIYLSKEPTMMTKLHSISTVRITDTASAKISITSAAITLHTTIRRHS